jgi:hypothetical protein
MSKELITLDLTPGLQKPIDTVLLDLNLCSIPNFYYLKNTGK